GWSALPQYSAHSRDIRPVSREICFELSDQFILADNKTTIGKYQSRIRPVISFIYGSKYRARCESGNFAWLDHGKLFSRQLFAFDGLHPPPTPYKYFGAL